MRVESGAASRPSFDREAVLEAACIVDEPFLQRLIPIVSDALARGAHTRLANDGAFVTSEAVAAEFQSPLPAAGIWLSDEAATVKTGLPLLAGIARLKSFRSALYRNSSAAHIAGG